MTALRARWAALSDRERLLVAVMAGLAVLLLLTLLVLRPLAAARSEGLAAFRAAAETRAAVARAAANGDGAAPVGGGDLRAVASQTAEARGIVIDRYDFQEDAVDLTITGIQAPDLYAWLGALSEEHGVVVREAQLRRGEGGELTARLTLEQRG